MQWCLLQEKPTISLIYKVWVGSNRHLWLLWECRYRQSLPAEYAAEEVALVEDQRRVEQYVASRYISPVRPCFCATLRRTLPCPCPWQAWARELTHRIRTKPTVVEVCTSVALVSSADLTDCFLTCNPWCQQRQCPLLLDPHPEQAGRLLR